MTTVVKDGQTYQTDLKITSEALAALNLFGKSFRGAWDYAIKPQES